MRVCELLSFLACHMLPLIAPVTCRPFHEPLYSDHSIVLRGGEEGEREKGEEREKIKRHKEREGGGESSITFLFLIVLFQRQSGSSQGQLLSLREILQIFPIMKDHVKITQSTCTSTLQF